MVDLELWRRAGELTGMVCRKLDSVDVRLRYSRVVNNFVCELYDPESRRFMDHVLTTAELKDAVLPSLVKHIVSRWRE